MQPIYFFAVTSTAWRKSTFHVLKYMEWKVAVAGNGGSRYREM